MKALFRQLRAAPAHVAATIASLALALAALGVFAVPAVSVATLQDAAEADNLAHVTAPVTPFEPTESLEELPSVTQVEARLQQTVDAGSGESIPLVGLDFDTQSVNLVSADTGRLPAKSFEAVAHEDLAVVGDEIEMAGGTVTVVGIGSTSARADSPSLYVPMETASTVTGTDAPNLLLLRLDDTSGDSLDDAVEDLRTAVAAEGGSLTAFPETRKEGTHPIDDDLATVSMMIGGLGVVAGVVALTLLASTTNTLISERTRDSAVMRALGSRRRPLRRRLRRVAIAMAAAGALIGIPLGIVVSNVIARIVLERFVGLTPGLAVAWPVAIGSAVFALLGARLAAGHAARRVTRIPLAEALRDHDGAPFGRRWSDRILARISTGGLLGRVGIRNTARRRARSFGVVAQAAAGVTAVVIVASMWTSIASFDEAELEQWRWETMTTPADPGYPYDATVSGDDTLETALYTDAKLGDWEIEVYGVEPDTAMLNTSVEAGSWFDTDGSAATPGAMPGAVVTAGFAEFEKIEVGDTIAVELGSGATEYEILGTHSYRSRAIFVERDDLAVELGVPDAANVIWSTGESTLEPTTSRVDQTLTQAQFAAEDQAARAAILYIFGVIGVIVVAVAALGLSSTMLVNLHERRHELASLRSQGARRGQIRRLLAIETVPLVVVGWAVGLAAGWLGAAALIAMFEAADAVYIGFVFAGVAVPVTAAAVVAGAIVLGHIATRSSARHSPAAVLRTSA